MEDLDFSIPGQPAQPAKPARPAAPPQPDVLYQPQVALAFFRDGGAKPETVPAGKQVFVENQKAGGFFSRGEKMYLLLEGEIGLVARGQFVGNVRQGEIIGEMALIAGMPRTATALAKTECKLLAIDEKQFHGALAKTPEFALMLMSIMVKRLRAAMARLAAEATGGASAEKGAVFDKKLLAQLVEATAETPPIEARAGKVIMTAGAAGTFMYVVQSGRVAIMVGQQVVERVGPGGVFGEMALVDRGARAASAVAEVDSMLLALGRADFLALVKTNPAFGASLLKAIAERTAALASR